MPYQKIHWFYISIICIFFQTTSIADIMYGPQKKQVEQFIHDMHQHDHFNEQTLKKLFKQVKVEPHVLKLIQTPYESKPWPVYQKAFITKRHVNNGKVFLKKHQKTLGKIEKIYGVPAEIITAILGIESLYGQRTGHYKAVNALSTLAFYYPKRADFFRYELRELLLLAREKQLNLQQLKGSYAGAMGPLQFMPHSCRQFGVHFSKQGKIDLQHNMNDIMASIANYLKQNGWHAHEPIAMPIALSEKQFRQFDFSKQPYRSTKQLLRLTKQSMQNKQLPQQSSVLMLPTKKGNQHWLTFNNFNVIKRYNNSNLYAMVAYELAGKFKK